LQHPLRLHAVITGSEPLYPAQRELIERTFGCQVFDFYGMAERVAFAAQCEHGSYHLHPEYAYVEILDQLGEPTDGFGHVVGTTLHNRVMPLVRYRIADRARWLLGPCPCGRSYPRIELSSGKVEEQLYDKEGVPVSASIITFALKGLKHIHQTQVAQIGPGQWEVRVVPEGGHEVDSAALLTSIADHVSQHVQLRVRTCDHIPLQSNSKFKWISQEWPGAKALGERP
jgi:phenylacetate-CoA ligase